MKLAIWLDRFRQDIRHAWRVFAKAPGFTAIAVLSIACVGLYGLVSYAVSRRTREIGIRIAIGATYARILNMILRQGMRPAWVGLPIGLVLSVVTTRLMPLVLPSTDRTDVRLFLIAVPLLFAVVLFAAFVPARRAAKVDPTIALRCE